MCHIPMAIDQKITPLKINGWNLKMMVWKMIFLSKWVICGFHVNLSGCTVVRYFVTLSVFISKSSDEPSLGDGVKDGFVYIVNFDQSLDIQQSPLK